MLLMVRHQCFGANLGGVPLENEKPKLVVVDLGHTDLHGNGQETIND
jgi:hypothetical protein